MQAVDKVRAVPRLEQKPTDSIGSHVEVPLIPNSSHQQGEIAGQEISMSQLYGDTTDNKESTRNTEQRDGQDVGKDSSQMVSRLYGDTTDMKESVSPSNAEEKPRLMSELCACGDPTDPDALTRLYENSENKKQYDEDKQSTSVLYQAGTPPDEGDQIGDMSATGTSPNSNETMPCHQDTAPPGTDMQIEAVNCQTASVTSITTEMLNPMYKHNVPQGAKKEGSTVIKAVITGMENPVYRKNVSQGATDQDI
ncbi:uncharacterized protein LOC144908189 [Branchiostoma floridae x Branchiostoma belcheri]